VCLRTSDDREQLNAGSEKGVVRTIQIMNIEIQDSVNPQRIPESLHSLVLFKRLCAMLDELPFGRWLTGELVTPGIRSVDHHKRTRANGLQVKSEECILC
jgi:hypothetical protein